ncbi:hypothetical protein BOX15_Mlig027171g2, partial [Macrostomum lignano]
NQTMDLEADDSKDFEQRPPRLLGPDDLPAQDTSRDISEAEGSAGPRRSSASATTASAALAQPDFIMEDSKLVLAEMAAFMLEVGDAEALTEHLVGGYEGAAQHCNILANWLVNFADESAEDAKSSIESSLADRVTAAFDPVAVDESIIAEDPVAFLNWLTELVQFRQWRDLIYQLAQRHSTCAFLNWAIKEISERGFEEEMKHVPAACAKLPVFCRYLSTSLSKLLAEEFDRSMEKDLEQLLDMACYGEATYLFSQVLLYNLAQTPVNGRGHTVRRLGQELEKAALARGRDVSRYSVQLCGAHHYPRATSAMQSMLAKRQLNPADMLTLYQLYKQQDPPPAALLRLPLFVQLLTDALFLPESQEINAEYLHTYVYLLAVAAAARDSSSSLDTGHSGELSLTEAAIKRASDICRSNKHVMQSVRDLIKALRYPVVAYGVLGFVEKALSDERGCDLSQVEQASVYLILVDEVATNHPHLRPRILPMLCRLFEQFHPSLDELSQLEFKVRLVDRFVHLMFVGHVEPVLDYMHSCLTSKLSDMSLLRHFVLEVLDMVEPPYTESFVRRLRPLVESPDIYNAIERKEGRDSCDRFLKDSSRTMKAASRS